ncbi:hypothetical protein LCL85_14020 [Vibrio alginolyticus]|nr:hypothetical protein [Vibrio alginolyticus]
MVDLLFRESDEKVSKFKINPFKQIQRVKLIRQFIADLTELNYIHDDISIYHYGGSLDSRKLNKLHKKLDSGNEVYAQGNAHGYVLFVDTTILGSGKCGLLFTEQSFYICLDHGDNIRQYRYEELFSFAQFRANNGDLLVGWGTYEFHASETMSKLQPVFQLMTKYFSENRHLSIVEEKLGLSSSQAS